MTVPTVKADHKNLKLLNHYVIKNGLVSFFVSF